MSEPGDLLPLYLDSDTTRIRLIGGTRNGKVVTLSTGEPPPRLEVAVERPLSDWFKPGSDLTDPCTPSFLRAAYAPMLDEVGYPSRTDDGVLLYECIEEPTR